MKTNKVINIAFGVMLLVGGFFSADLATGNWDSKPVLRINNRQYVADVVQGGITNIVWESSSLRIK